MASAVFFVDDSPDPDESPELEDVPLETLEKARDRMAAFDASYYSDSASSAGPGRGRGSGRPTSRQLDIEKKAASEGAAADAGGSGGRQLPRPQRQLAQQPDDHDGQGPAEAGDADEASDAASTAALALRLGGEGQLANLVRQLEQHERAAGAMTATLRARFASAAELAAALPVLKVAAP